MAIAPQAGEFLGGRSSNDSPDARRRGAFDVPDGKDLHPLVRWANAADSALEHENRGEHNRMKRNRDQYDGKQWSGMRAPWKNKTVLNYSAWVCDQWASVLADNKPKVTFESYLQDLQYEADIMTAAWEDCYSRRNWQGCIEDVILCSRIDGVSYLHPVYDPYADEGEGAPLIKKVLGTQLSMDRDAHDPYDAVLLRYEYYLPLGEVLAKWPHLREVLRPDGNAPGSPSGAAYSQQAGTQIVYDTANQQIQQANITAPMTLPAGENSFQGAYKAPTAPPSYTGTGGQRVREYWQRPKGPSAQTTVKKIKFGIDGKPVTRRKFMRFPDGSVEPLKTVITEGQIVYELSSVDADIMQYVSDIGGLQVLGVFDALEVVQEEVAVPLFPAGRRTVIVGDYLADDGMNPFGHGRFPFIPIYAYRSAREKHGISDIDRVYTLQDYLNRLYSLLLDAAILTSNPIWLIPTDSQIADEDLTNAPGAIIRGEMTTLKLARREKGPDMPAYVTQLIQLTIAQIREISGLSESATGGKFKGQQAAETVSMYQEAASVRFRQGIRNVEQAIIELGYQFAGIVKQFYNTPRWVRVRQAAGCEQPISFVGADLMAPLVMKAKAGGALPLSPSARLNIYMGLMNTPVLDLRELWRVAQEVGIIDSASAIEGRMKRYAQELGLQGDFWMAPGLMQMVMGGQKGGKSRGGKSGGNSGRSARSSTPSKAASVIGSAA